MYFCQQRQRCWKAIIHSATLGSHQPELSARDESWISWAPNWHLSEILRRLRRAQGGSLKYDLVNIGKLGSFKHLILSLSIENRLASKQSKTSTVTNYCYFPSIQGM